MYTSALSDFTSFHLQYSMLAIISLQITVRVLSSQNPNIAPGSVNVFKTPGNVYKQTIENILPDTIYNISVEAGSQGTFGPAVWELVSAGKLFSISGQSLAGLFSARSLCILKAFITLMRFTILISVPQGVPEIREPRVSQRGETTSVAWDVAGPLQRLCCYQV